MPALAAALEGIRRPATLRVYTDQPSVVRDAWLQLNTGRRIDMFDVPGPDGSFESMSRCHRDTLDWGKNDRVLLLTADMVVSREVLHTCEHQLNAGRQLVCCVALRALQDAPGIPVGVTGSDLLSWAWDNRHRMTRECTWPAGRSYDVWRMYFQEGEEVAARVFMPHPLAVAPRGRRLAFRPTIDVNLVSNFSGAVTHMITDPGEGAVIELSPADKEFLETESMSTRMETRGPSCPAFVRCTNKRHRFFFEKRVLIRGSGGDCGDEDVVRRMIG